MKQIRLGIAGLGRAFMLMLPSLLADSRYCLVACADPREEARARFVADFSFQDQSARAYAAVEDLVADPAIDGLYIATPHQFHSHHVILASEAKKHCLVEKPMALTIEECEIMIEAARKQNIHLVIGHSHSFDGPIRQARGLIASGALGRVRLITALNYTDFLYRPRRPEELSTAAGGGIIYNQAPHQIDIVRLLAGGRAASVRALTGAWDPARPTEGAYAGLLTFEDGAFGTITYSGFAHFDASELCDWVAESGAPKDPQAYGVTRRLLSRAMTAEEELELKNSINYGGPKSTPFTPPDGPRFHPHFGLVIVSCEKGDIRPTPKGLAIYDDFRQGFEPLEPPSIPRQAVLDEFYNAVVENRPPLHNGSWGLATMEVCLALLTSAKTGQEISLVRQVAVPEGE